MYNAQWTVDNEMVVRKMKTIQLILVNVWILDIFLSDESMKIFLFFQWQFLIDDFFFKLFASTVFAVKTKLLIAFHLNLDFLKKLIRNWKCIENNKIHKNCEPIDFPWCFLAPPSPHLMWAIFGISPNRIQLRLKTLCVKCERKMAAVEALMIHIYIYTTYVFFSVVYTQIVSFIFFSLLLSLSLRFASPFLVQCMCMNRDADR